MAIFISTLFSMAMDLNIICQRAKKHIKSDQSMKERSVLRGKEETPTETEALT